MANFTIKSKNNFKSMFYSFVAHIFLISIFPWLVVSMELIVDTSLTSNSGNSYPSLDKALSALLNGSNLIDSENTITLRANCVGTYQSLPICLEDDSTQFINGTSLGGASVRIVFENAPPSIEDSSICSQLPTLIFSSNSCFSASNLYSLNFSGLNIQYEVIPDTSNIIANLGILTFSTICLNSLESSNADQYSGMFQYVFQMQNVTKLLLKNGLYNFNVRKKIRFYGGQEMTLDNFNFFFFPNSSTDLAFEVSAELFILNNTRISCLPEAALTGKLFEIWNFNQILINNLFISDCEIGAMDLFGIWEGSALIAQGVVFENLILRNYYFNTIFLVWNVQTLILSNFSISNLYTTFPFSSDDFQTHIVHFSQAAQPEFKKCDVNISGWHIRNSTLISNEYLISIDMYLDDNPKQVVIENFSIVDSFINSKSNLINLQFIEEGTWNTTNQELTHVALRNINVINTEISYSVLFLAQFSYEHSDIGCIFAIENVHLEVTNLSLYGNSLNQSSIIQAEGVCTYISNIIAEHNTLQSASNFFLSSTVLSSLLINNAVIKNLKLENCSAFAVVNLTSARIANLDSAMDGGKNGIFAETRPFMVYNCSFDSIQIATNSYLLDSTNPMVIIQQNNFTNLLVRNSELFRLGNYPFFLFTLPSFSKSSFENLDTILVCTFAENAIFQSHPNLGEIYDNSRRVISSYEPDNSIFFIWVNENIISSTRGENINNLIEIHNFEIKNGTIMVLNNSFNNISFHGSLNLISGSTVQRGVFALNTFAEIDVAGYAFSFTSSSFENLRFEFNSMLRTQQLSFYSINSAECKKILLRSNFALDIQIKNSFMDIACDIIGERITIENSTFGNIFQTNGPKTMATVNFISLKTKKVFSIENSSIHFQDNVFSNVTVNIQGFVQTMFQSSIVFIVSLKSEVHFKNNSFNLITATPKGGILILSLPKITFSNCTFSNLSFGSADGAIYAIFANLSIQSCSFLASQSSLSNGAGIFKLTNCGPTNIVLRVDIQNSTFQDNVAPFGTMIYAEDTAIILTLNDSIISNNQITKTSGILTLHNVSKSNIIITHSIFEQNEGDFQEYSPLKVVSLESSRPAVSVQMSDLTLKVTENIVGTFISISGQYPVSLLATHISYSAGSDSSSFLSPPSQFGLFEGDNFEANFTHLEINNISMGRASMFIINAKTAKMQSTTHWHLAIYESIWENMTLLAPLITINSDDYLPLALDNLSVVIQNSFLYNITWLGSSAGVISSSTHHIGRSLDTRDVDDGDDFGIVLRNCTFTNITGHKGLIISTVEPMFDLVALVENCKFSLITADGPGAILNLNMSLLSSNTLSLLGDSNRKRNPTVKISGNFFENILSSSGTLLFWVSTLRGAFIYSEDNNFAHITCSGNGGLIFAQYLPTNKLVDLSAVSYFNVVSKNDIVSDMSTSQNGGIIYVEGVNQLVNISFAKITLVDIECTGNGGVVYVSRLFKAKDTSFVSSNRLLTDSQLNHLTGIIRISESQLVNITAQNGGVLYESTPKNTLSLVFDSNILQNVFARERGGAFYLLKPTSSIKSNMFNDVTAKLAGSIIYSVSDQPNLIDFGILNEIKSANDKYLVSFAPNSLLVSFISPTDNPSSIIMEYETTPPYNPIFSNLTSYSLFDYLIKLTLVYNGSQGPQVVHDESPNPLITLDFISSRIGRNQSYVGNDCSNSSCIVNASTQTLIGLAGDLILVNANYSSNAYKQSQQFYIRLRSCTPGEINNTASYECIHCEFGTYSLTPTDSKCFDCPTGAICMGGSVIIIKPGFYRSFVSPTNLNILSCNDSEKRCLGGVNNSCSPPFSGPACLQCNSENKYIIRGNSEECILCSSKTAVIAIAVLLAVATIVFQIVTAVITIKENKSIYLNYKQHKKLKASQPAQLLVIFLTYIQITSIVASLGDTIDHPLLDTVNIVGNPFTQVMHYIQCLYLFSTSDTFKALQTQVLIYVLSPLVKILVIGMFELIRNLIWKDPEGLGRKKSLIRVGAVAVILILSEQPGIVGILCNYLTCSKLDPLSKEFYIKTHNSVQCYTEEYNSFMIFVIMALVFWAVLVPLGIFVTLCILRRRKFVWQSLRIAIGKLYNSYSEKSYYWGIVMIVFKVTIYMLNSLINASQILKGVIFMIIIEIYFYFLKRSSPYPYKYLDLAEQFCYKAYMIMLTLVFIRLSTDTEGIQKACRILIDITICVAAGYILLTILFLYSLQFMELIMALKEKRKQEQMSLETLELLRMYHSNNPPRIDQHRRRGGICLVLPERRRNHHEYEHKRKEKSVEEWLNKTKLGRKIWDFLNADLHPSAKLEEKSKKDKDRPNMIELCKSSTNEAQTENDAQTEKDAIDKGGEEEEKALSFDKQLKNKRMPSRSNFNPEELEHQISSSSEIVTNFGRTGEPRILISVTEIVPAALDFS